MQMRLGCGGLFQRVCQCTGKKKKKMLYVSENVCAVKYEKERVHAMKKILFSREVRERVFQVLIYLMTTSWKVYYSVFICLLVCLGLFKFFSIFLPSRSSFFLYIYIFFFLDVDFLLTNI